MTNAEKSNRKSRPNGATAAAKAAAQSLASLKKANEERRFAMRARLAKRDLEYAASPCAAQVTVEMRGNRVIETRGNRCVGFAASSERAAY